MPFQSQVRLRSLAARHISFGLAEETFRLFWSCGRTTIGGFVVVKVALVEGLGSFVISWGRLSDEIQANSEAALGVVLPD